MPNYSEMIEDMSQQMLDDGDQWLDIECAVPEYDFVAEAARLEALIEQLSILAFANNQYEGFLG